MKLVHRVIVIFMGFSINRELCHTEYFSFRREIVSRTDKTLCENSRARNCDTKERLQTSCTQHYSVSAVLCRTIDGNNEAGKSWESRFICAALHSVVFVWTRFVKITHYIQTTRNCVCICCLYPYCMYIYFTPINYDRYLYEEWQLDMSILRKN